MSFHKMALTTELVNIIESHGLRFNYEFSEFTADYMAVFFNLDGISMSLVIQFGGDSVVQTRIDPDEVSFTMVAELECLILSNDLVNAVVNDLGDDAHTHLNIANNGLISFVYDEKDDGKERVSNITIDNKPISDYISDAVSKVNKLKYELESIFL